MPETRSKKEPCWYGSVENAPKPSPMSTSIPVLPIHLAALAERPSWTDALVFQLNGLVVVFVALGSIWLAMTVAGWFFRRAAAKPMAVPAGPAAAAPAATAAPEAAGDGLEPETLAEIAAAVHATLGPRYRVRAVATGDMHIEWAQEGRRQIFASHKVR